MDKDELLKEAIQLELNASELYRLYFENEQFKEDADFWWKISQEEQRHAALLKTAKNIFNNLPEQLIYDSLAVLKNVNQNIRNTIEKYKKAPPARKEAYLYAYNLENSAYELHYQKMVTEKTDKSDLKTFQKLNADDKDHAERIKNLLSKYKIA